MILLWINKLVPSKLIIGTTHISNTFAYRSTTSSNWGTQTPKHFPSHSCWQSHLYPLSQCSSWGSIASTLTQKSLKWVKIYNKDKLYRKIMEFYFLVLIKNEYKLIFKLTSFCSRNIQNHYKFLQPYLSGSKP